MTATTHAVAGREPVHAAAVAALRERLDELMRVVLTLSAETYAARVSRVSGSVGEHVRHVLDHVSSLVACPGASVLSYDHRTRGTSIESDPGAAIREMMRLDAALERWLDRSLDAPIIVAAVMSAGGDSLRGWSTLARELAYVMSHTVHHQAIVALLLEQQGRDVPGASFGYAPSTPLRS